MRLSHRARWGALFEDVTVGLPFCVFKAASGIALLQGSPMPWGQAMGYALLCLGMIDAGINTVNLFGIALARSRWIDECASAILSRLVQRPRSFAPEARVEFGKAVDVFLSFGLVAGMIGMGALRTLPSPMSQMWDMAVILNVLGAGIMRLKGAMGR